MNVSAATKLGRVIASLQIARMSCFIIMGRSALLADPVAQHLTRPQRRRALSDFRKLSCAAPTSQYDEQFANFVLD